MANSLVTIVVPAYNAANTVGKTLESVQAQTHRDLEILVVDDGSTDATASIVQTYARADERVRLIRQANGGVAAARNRGLEEGQGAFIATIDADDLWKPNKIARQMALMLERGEKVGLVYTWSALIDSQDRITSLDLCPEDEGNVLLALFVRNIVGNGSAPLMRTHVVRECGGYDMTLRERGAQGCEDLQLYIRIAENYEFAVVKEYLTGYRFIRGTMSSDVRQMFRSREFVLSNFKSVYPQHAPIFEKARNRALRLLTVRALRERNFSAASDLCGLALRSDPANIVRLTGGTLSAAARKLLTLSKRSVRQFVSAERPEYFLGTPEHLAPHPTTIPSRGRARVALASQTNKVRARPRMPGRAKDNTERLFCSQPFTRFEVLGGGGSRGDVFFCCQSWLKTSIGNMQKRSVQEIWNGREARKIRRSILDGSFRHCEAVCPYLQRVDGPVQRVSDVRDEAMLEIIRTNQTRLLSGPREVICTFDQSCNLSCPSCRTHIIMETAHGTAIVDIQKQLENEALRDARLLYITGSGDPFGSPMFRQWLQTMDTSKMPKLERIHLHTNALLWTERIWETIPQSTRDLIRGATISIDAATPNTYAVNRRGGDFRTLLERLAFIADLRRQGPLNYLEFHMTVQANNYREMPMFVQLGRAHKCDRVSFHQLLDWGSFSPDEYTARAIQLDTHPEHQAFLNTLYDETLDDPLVYLSNLTSVKQRAARPTPVRCGTHASPAQC